MLWEYFVSLKCLTWSAYNTLSLPWIYICWWINNYTVVLLIIKSFKYDIFFLASKNIILKNIYLLVVLGLHCYARAFSSCSEWGSSSCSVRASYCSGVSCCEARTLGTEPSVVVAWGLRSCGTWAYCPMACGIFLDQKLNSCPLHCPADSLPLSCHGSPQNIFFGLSFVMSSFLLSFLSL